MSKRNNATPPLALPPMIPLHPSRRSLLAAGTAAMLTGATIAAARAAPTGDDAELIGLCNRLVANRAEWVALCQSRHTLEDERRTEPDNQRLNDELRAMLDQIEAAPDLSAMAGAAAMARAAIALTPLNKAGDHWEASEDNEWLALTVAEFLAGRAGT